MNLSTRGLSERWHVTPGHLANMRAQGRGPAYLKIGSRVVYPLTVIEEYEDSHLVRTAA
jgi:hypothetical protein